MRLVVIQLHGKCCYVNPAENTSRMFYLILVIKDNLVVQEYFVLIVVFVLIRPLALARYLDLNPVEYQDVLGI
jgi:hypothetical protein